MDGDGRRRRFRRVAPIASLLAIASVLAIWAQSASALIIGGAAGAGSLAVTESVPGEVNRIVIDFTSVGIVAFKDTAAGVTESPDSPNCKQISPTQVNCLTQGLQGLSLATGGGTDRVVQMGDYPQSGSCFQASVDLGEGADVAMLGTGLGSIGAGIGIGQLVVLGQGGDDRIQLGFKPSTAENGTVCQLTARGGDGNDTMSTTFRVGTKSLAFIPDGLAAAAALPRDLVQYATLFGEGDRDRLSLTGPGTARGGPQSDRLRGGPGPQLLFGESGYDWFLCGKGKDRASGGPGIDRGGRGCEKRSGLREILDGTDPGAR